MATKRGGLGTNLDSLIPTSLTVAGTEVAEQNEIPINQIFPNPRSETTPYSIDIDSTDTKNNFDPCSCPFRTSTDTPQPLHS